MLNRASDEVEWHYLDHGYWINTRGDLQRLSAEHLPSALVGNVRAPLHGRPPVEGGTSVADEAELEVDWFYVGNGWWMSEAGELERLSCAVIEPYVN
jgi:hypothetical protein